jgi:uncharacterized phiE125 gp8 family phage protein
MALKLNAPPEEEPISLEEAKAHLRVDINTDNELIEALIAAAREYCETFQGRAYITQTWELWLDAFPAQSWIQLPRPPLQAEELEVKYYDINDHNETFEDYFVDTKSEPGYIVLNTGAAWPSIILRPANGVCVTFTVGYGAAEDVPQKVKQAMLLIIGDWYENREAKSTIPKAAEALLWQDRCF